MDAFGLYIRLLKIANVHIDISKQNSTVVRYSTVTSRVVVGRPAANPVKGAVHNFRWHFLLKDSNHGRTYHHSPTSQFTFMVKYFKVKIQLIFFGFITLFDIAIARSRKGVNRSSWNLAWINMKEAKFCTPNSVIIGEGESAGPALLGIKATKFKSKIS